MALALLKKSNTPRRGRCIDALCALALFLSYAQAQQSYAQELSPEELEAQTTLDAAPLISARGAGMANAVSTRADSTDAAIYNPAGIGGFNVGPKKSGPKTFIRQFEFPYGGVAANANAVKLYKEYRESDAKNDAAVASAIVDSSKGKRQYARVSLFPNAVLGRLMVGPFVDQQLASVSHGNGSDLVTARHRALSGVAGGVSASDPRGRLYLGAFGTFASRTDVAGEFDFKKIIDADERTAEIKKNATKTTGKSVNLGMMAQFAETAAPRLALVLKDAGNTHYVSQDASKEIVEEQDFTMGLSVSPRLGPAGILNVIAEGHHLTSKRFVGSKKFRTGVEWQLGLGSGRPIFGLRAGYNLAGVSYGSTLDVGLIALEYANQAEDIGAGKRHVVERKHVAVVSINVAEY